MTDLLLTGILHAGITGFILLLLQRKIDLKAWWLLYVLIIVHHCLTYIIPSPFPGLSQNWQGKAAVSLLALGFIYTYPKIEKADYGWRWNIHPKSLLPVVAGTLLMALVMNLPAWLQHQEISRTTEKLIYFSSLPGIAEELMYRGVFLALLNSSLGKGFRIAGATMGWGSFIVAVLFGCFHGISVINLYHLGHNEIAFALTFLSGFFFCWVKERTGSLWPAILSHNLINLASLMF